MPAEQQQQQPQRVTFGALDQINCPNCGGGMRLTRRCPDPALAETHERQTFGCRVCDHELERTVDVDGRPPAGSAGRA